MMLRPTLEPRLEIVVRSGRTHARFAGPTSLTEYHAEAVNRQFSRLTDGQIPPHVLLDLGKVGDIAEVSLNGRALGQLWAAPYRIDITDALKPGENALAIKVTNQWTNRILGDAAVPAERKVLDMPPPPAGRGGGGGFGRGPATPPESGLMGPVMFLSETRS